MVLFAFMVVELYLFQEGASVFVDSVDCHFLTWHFIDNPTTHYLGQNNFRWVMELLTPLLKLAGCSLAPQTTTLADTAYGRYNK